jgi:hypothetical protein
VSLVISISSFFGLIPKSMLKIVPLSLSLADLPYTTSTSCKCKTRPSLLYACAINAHAVLLLKRSYAEYAKV